MALATKTFSIKELTDEGSVKAIISTFGQPDRDGEIMSAKAFDNSKGKSVPMVWSHDWTDPVGKGTVSATSTEAIFEGQFFMDTARGQEAYKTVKAMGDLQEYSIGFRVVDSEVVSMSGQRMRQFNDIELFEASPVLVGAAYGTGTLAVKRPSFKAGSAQDILSAASTIDALSDSLEEASDLLLSLLGMPEDEMMEHGKDPTDLLIKFIEGYVEKAGRSMSQPKLDQFHGAMKQLGDVHAAVCDMADNCPMATKAIEPINPSISPERTKTLQEIAARAARA